MGDFDMKDTVLQSATPDNWVDCLAKLYSPLNYLYGEWKKAELPDIKIV